VNANGAVIANIANNDENARERRDRRERKSEQKGTARQSHNHKQEDQSQPNGISCMQRTLRNAEETKR
jgi:hypothetical protein